MSDAPRRVGVFGGTFDPIHNGHLLIAEQARELLELDLVLFVPAAAPPHKLDSAVTDAAHRVGMVAAAIADNRRFQLSTIEIERPGPSYTVDTLRQLHAADPACELFLLLGGDSLADFIHWREPEVVASLATLVVVRRPGSPEPDLNQLSPPLNSESASRIRVLNTPQFEVASRDLRRRIAAGRSLRYLVPEAAIAYIARNRLYLHSEER